MALYDVSTSEKKANPELVAGGTLYADSPIGAILPYGGASAPSGWFLCQGQALSRTIYSELFAVIGTSFGVGDGSTTFNLPDMRESVPKGAGLTGHTVGDHVSTNGLAAGEFLDDRVQEHTHYTSPTPTQGYQMGSTNWALSSGTPSSSSTSGIKTGRKGATTEVKSVGVNYIIKAKMVAIPNDFMDKVDEAVAESIIVKKGTWTGNVILQKMGDSQKRDRFSIPITFDTPMPDDNYTVIIEFFESIYITIRSGSKTANGFNLEGANADNVATSNLSKITWTAIRFPS